MKLGFVSAILPDLNLDGVFQTAAEIGYDCVELMCWPVGKAQRRYAGVTHVDVGTLDDATASEIRQRADRYDIEISGLGFYPNPLAPDQDESARAIEHIRKVIAACRTLGIRQMNTFIGRDWTRSIEDNWPQFTEVWKPIISFAEECDVRVGIENCPMFFTGDEWPGGKNLAISPAIWRRMFTDIPSKHFGLNYDPSHMIFQQMDYLQPMRDFADRIFHAHAKDVRIDRQRLNDVGILAMPLEYHTPKLPGLGDVNWGQFFSILSDTGYRGPVCVEVEDRAYEESLATRKAALRQSCVYLRQFISKPEN